jgi:threonine synthase
MTLAISKAVEEGSTSVMCASTGNTSASAAAYAARAGIKCAVLIPEGAIALGKLSQALMHGAKVIAIKGNFDDALDIVKKITSSHPVTLVNSLNPYRLQGQKTGSFEICDQLRKAPDYHFIPVGNAGNITAYWMGYKEYKDKGKIDSLPKMVGWQAEGSAPIVKKMVIKKPETIATAIRIGNPARWKEAEEAASSSGGFINAVTDEEILKAYHFLAQEEGIFAEPASCASVAGLLKAKEKKLLQVEGSTIVCVLTGCGLKDPDRAVQQSPKPTVLSKEETNKILDIIGIK